MSTSFEFNASGQRRHKVDLAEDGAVSDEAIDLTDAAPIDLRDPVEPVAQARPRWGTRKAADSKVSSVPERWGQRRRAAWHRD